MSIAEQEQLMRVIAEQQLHEFFTALSLFIANLKAITVALVSQLDLDFANITYEEGELLEISHEKIISENESKIFLYRMRFSLLEHLMDSAQMVQYRAYEAEIDAEWDNLLKAVDDVKDAKFEL